MEVQESEWIDKAVENITRYLNRGGDLKGDEPQRLDGTCLLNTIGVAMGLPFRDPREWSETELQQALNNNLVYFEGDARNAIDVVANQIKHVCSTDSEIFITVLPLELYWEGKLYELPLFRVQGFEYSKIYYVDNLGRWYDDFQDWFTNNHLPPCKVAYPYDLKLTLRPGTNYSRVVVGDTPSARIGAHVIQALDITASVVGIGSSVGLIFATGGLAAPLVVLGVATAIWNTGRTAYQLADRATHGEDINPFNNSETRILWLGIAANIISFGAMGASLRLTSLAAHGRDISNSFMMLVNVINRTNIVISGIAMIDTTIFLIEHYDQLSSVDILMHVASIAFWTKGVFTYKTAANLISDAQNHTFNIISQELQPGESRELMELRLVFKNDAQLLREFHRASQANISIKVFSQIVFDSFATDEKLQFDGLGNLILKGGQKYSVEFLSSLNRSVRREYFNIITTLSKDEINLLESFRQHVNDDKILISGLHRFAVHYNLTAREATQQVLNFWEKYTQMKMPTLDISIKNDTLVIGRAPPLQLTELRGLSSPMIRFIGTHLVLMDETSSRQWTTSMPVLLQLESDGIFSKCQITRIVPTGRAVLLLNENLQISIYKLKEMDSKDCSNILQFIGQLSPNATSTEIPKDTRLLVDKYRFRLECQRSECVKWMNMNANEKLQPLLASNLQSFEKDRLFTFKSTVTTAKSMPYMKEMMSFVSDMNPRNVSEMVSYGEYVVTYVETEKRNLEGDLRSGQLKLPINTKKADFLRQKASDTVFKNPTAMLQKWETTVALVRENSMVGPAVLETGMSDDALVTAIRRARIGFGSEASAAYHVLKHPTNPPSAYVQRANEVIRSATRTDVTLSQDGDARLLRFEGPDGSAILLERDGRVLLCTFSPKSSKP